MNHRRRRHLRGMVLLDVAFALGLLAMLSVAIVMAAGRQNRASVKLQRHRAAAQQAEAALLTLRLGKTPPAAADGQSRLVLTPLDGAAPGSFRWVRAEVSEGEVKASVIGLVPETAHLPPATQRKGEEP